MHALDSTLIHSFTSNHKAVALYVNHGDLVSSTRCHYSQKRNANATRGLLHRFFIRMRAGLSALHHHPANPVERRSVAAIFQRRGVNRTQR